MQNRHLRSLFLNCNGQQWILEFVNPYSSILRNSDGEYTFGVTIPHWRRIYVANNITGELYKRVISHEVAHAEFSSRGVWYLPVYIEEIMADILCDCVVEDNNLTKYICNNC